MDWEDCTVDVHSIQLSRQELESLFKKCGPVRSITHWKGQGEKPHIFFEYKAPNSADAARLVGLDRCGEIQVIKLANNEMLKRKFRELAHGPIRDRDQRCRSLRPSSRSTSSQSTVKDYRLPDKPTTTPAYINERDPEGRRDPERASRSGRSWSPISPPDPRGTRPRTSQADPPRVSRLDSALYRSTFTRGLHESDVSKSRTRDRDSLRDCRDEETSVKVPEALSIASRDAPLDPRKATSDLRSTALDSRVISPTIIEIPHAGEIIKFNFNEQLEENPAGIIRILSAVKADQKLWMMTAAHYYGKRNLQSAKKVLEAGIDMAAQVGEESDTKPFWHLLGQINSNIRASAASVSSSTPSASPTASSFTSTTQYNHDGNEITVRQLESTLQSLKPLLVTKENPHLRPDSRELALLASPAFSSAAELHNYRNSSNTTSQGTPAAVSLPDATCPTPQLRPTGPRKREPHPLPPPPSPVPPSGPMGTPARLHSLQSEIGALREKQNVVLDDLSFTRAAKRRAEEEVKEERSVRRKLEKHLRAAEDALARSKRMEDAALDQVKREVEARRRAEGLLADVRAGRDAKVEVPAPLFAHPQSNIHDASVLLQLASMFRSVPSNDLAAALQFGNAGAVPVAGPANTNPSET